MSEHPERIAFGDFLVERSQQRVRHRDGSLVELTPRLFKALLLFTERAGELIAKDSLLTLLWPGLVVEENNLSQLVHGLREVLSDTERPYRYVETVPRRGFRFVAAVTELADEAAPARGKLALATTRLYGREAETAALAAQVLAHPVVSVLGAGGIGKTRLALAAATAVRAQFADGCWWVELAAVNDAELLPSAVASALALRLPTGAPKAEALAEALADQRLLLVLDNCEQVAAGVALMVDALRARAGGVHILITSQEAVKAAAERVFRPGTLGLPDGGTLAAAAQSPAVALFVDRASAAAPGFELNADNAADVVDICQRLDGIPLALELAAARVPLLGVRLLRARLDERFRLLTGGGPGRPPRQQTLRAALEWSCALLGSRELTLLRRLGVMSGGFSLPLAQRVASDAEGGLDAWAVLDLLGALVDKSLVLVEPGPVPRYRLLEGTRAYALELLANADELAALRRRHAEAVLELLEAAGAARWLAQAPDDAALARELDNARAALDWSLTPVGERRLGLALHAASMPLWIATGLKAEGADRCAALGAWADETDVPPSLAAQFWLTVAMMGLYSARQECSEAAARAASLYRRCGDQRRTFEALVVRTGVAARRSEYELAALALAEAEQLLDPAWPARRRADLAFAAWISALNAQQHERATAHAWRQVAICRETGVALDEALALGNVGIAEINVPGRELAGEARLREALRLLAAAGRPELGGKMLYSLSLTLLRRGDLADALAQARLAYRLLRREGEQSLMLGLMPLLAVRREEFTNAAHAAGYAAAVYARAGLAPRGLYGEAMARLQQALPARELAGLMAEGGRLSEEAAFARVLAEAPSQP